MVTLYRNGCNPFSITIIFALINFYKSVEILLRLMPEGVGVTELHKE